jgi:hypothetical protein
VSLSSLKTAFYERAAGIEVLTGEAEDAQTALGTLLAVDPDTSAPNERPAVFQGNTGVIPVYDCLIFVESGGTPDNRFAADVGGIRDPILDVYIWSKKARGNAVSDIHDLVDQLFNERRGVSPLLTLDAGRIYHMEALTDLTKGYDREVNAWFGFSRYRFILAHY